MSANIQNVVSELRADLGTPESLAYTTSASPGVLFAMFASENDGPAACSGVSFDGAAMTLMSEAIVTSGPDENYASIWALESPSASTSSDLIFTLDADISFASFCGFEALNIVTPIPVTPLTGSGSQSNTKKIYTVEDTANIPFGTSQIFLASSSNVAIATSPIGGDYSILFRDGFDDGVSALAEGHTAGLGAPNPALGIGISRFYSGNGGARTVMCYVVLETAVTPSLVMTGIIPNSRVYVRDVTNTIDLFNQVEPTSTFSGTIPSANIEILIRIVEAPGAPHYKPFEITVTVPTQGLILPINQELDE